MVYNMPIAHLRDPRYHLRKSKRLIDTLMRNESNPRKKTLPKSASDVVEGIPRSPLHEQVANRLRDMIVESDLAPGERIRERNIAAQLNVSRTPLREALHVLSTEGLVELIPNRGAVIAQPSQDEIADMLRILGVLEGFAGELACQLATDDEVAEIRALHFEMLAAFSRGERLDYFKINQKIHLSIIDAARSETLSAVHATLNTRLYRVRYQSNLRNERWGSAVAEHEEILSALEARDGTRLGGLLRTHLSSTWDKVAEVLSQPREKD